ncbi:gamma-butyrobetaine hydroxylase-like domain-containing protein [Litorivicinus lipolyticus]|nr:DUF971 domain-containing protein [Litorivicinus lipolyticus]
MSALTGLTMRRASSVLELAWDDGLSASLSAEFLRVHSPSAEVRGHGPGQAKLVDAKQDVGFVRMEPVGNYGAKLIFDDGHDSGIYSWVLLRELAEQHDSLWQRYLEQLAEAGKKRSAGGVKLFSVKTET